MRYAKLKPDAEIPNDLYNYHLRKLVSDGIVEKTSEGYTLSSTGKRHVADAHHTSDQSDRLFKYNVLLIVAREINGTLHILNQRRTAQPSYGIVGIPGGTILKSEPLLAGAARKLQQETGLVGTFQYIGTERRIFYRDSELFSDVLFPICLCEDAAGEPGTTEFGENFWVTIADAIVNDSRPDDHIEFIPQVLRALQCDTLDQVHGFYHEQIIR